MLPVRKTLPAPAYDRPEKATELEGPIRLYIGGTALHEKALKASPPSGPGGSRPRIATCF